MRQATPLATRWEGPDLVVLRDKAVVDRIAGVDIRRVILVCERGDTPSDLGFALIETGSDAVILPAESGIAGCIHFERHGFWMQHPCIYWTHSARAHLPRHLAPGVWLLRRHRPAYARVPMAELAPLVDQWPLEGPQTWEQRKWARIDASRALAPAALPVRKPELPATSE
jgi:hypothetical protein